MPQDLRDGGGEGGGQATKVVRQCFMQDVNLKGTLYNN